MNVLRLKGTMLMNKVEFLEETEFFLVRPKTYFEYVLFSIVDPKISVTASK